MITTYNGVAEEKDSCVFIRGKWYHKERDCYFLNGIYYSPFSRYMVLDHETGEKVHMLSKTVKLGIVGFNEVAKSKKKTPVFGYFSENIGKNCKILAGGVLEDPVAADDYSSKLAVVNSDSGEVTPSISGSMRLSRGCAAIDVVDYKMLEANGYRETRCSDILVKNGEEIKFTEATGMSCDRISAEIPYSFTLAYNSEVMMDAFASIFKDSPYETTPRIEALAELIGDRTFGIEYEAWDGRIPTYKCANNGLIPLRDGSLRHDGYCGYEYATVIMSGEKGIASIKSQCATLKHHAFFNERCSTHVHVGNIPQDEASLVNIYRAFYTIQDSMYSLFPSCLRHTSRYKTKDYCSELPNIPFTADNIVAFLSDGNQLYKEFGRKHPKDSTGQSKWNINSRYVWANLNNYYYTSRGTVELRISTPTFNHNKVMALLILTNAIISEGLNGRFHESVESLIESFIADVEIKKWLLSYVAYRKKVLSHWAANGDHGVNYYENYDNDGETGCSGDLY